MSDQENLNRVGRLIVDVELSDEDKAALAFALQRDTRFVAQQKTEMRIDVFEVDHD